MRKIWWVLLIGLGVVVFAFTWQHIPYVNTWIWESGLPQAVADFRTGVTEGINNLDPRSLLGVSGVLLTTLVAAIKKGWNTIKGDRLKFNEFRATAQAEKGAILATAQEVKDSLTGDIDALKEQFTKLENADKLKDEQILALEQEKNGILEELSKIKDDLRTAETQRDSVLIKLKEYEIPTFH